MSSADAHDVIRICRELAAFSEEAGATTRTFLSPPMRQVHARLGEWMTRAGMSVLVDAAGNLRGTYAARSPAAARLLIGSHLDTVPHAGAFDGILGVVLGIALVEQLAGRRLPFAVDVIGFSDEEGVRFGVPFIGSRAVVGTVDDALLARRDGNGCSVREAIERFGLDPAAIGEAVVESAIAYVEFHIEQGPVLDSLDRPLGVVNAIVGQTRLDVTFAGSANHAGTTPMSGRRDALAAAAEWITAVEADARARGGLVATVGRMAVAPGATNVIPGSVEASLDVRHEDDGVRRTASERMTAAARTLASRRGVGVGVEVRLDQAAVPMDDAMTAMMARAVERSGSPVHRMPSGAGHDAMILAPHVPAAMLFVRTPAGISHHPDETVREADVAAALAAGRQFLDDLADRD